MNSVSYKYMSCLLSLHNLIKLCMGKQGPAGSVLPHGENGASLALVGHPSSDGVTIKMPYGVDVLH